MTDLELAARLREVLVAAQRRHRTKRGVLGALTTLPIADGLIDEIADGLAPVLREFVETVVDTRLNPGGFAADELRIDAFVRGDGHRSVRATHIATGLAAVGEGANARRDALLELWKLTRDTIRGEAS